MNPWQAVSGGPEKRAEGIRRVQVRLGEGSRPWLVGWLYQQSRKAAKQSVKAWNFSTQTRADLQPENRAELYERSGNQPGSGDLPGSKPLNKTPRCRPPAPPALCTAPHALSIQDVRVAGACMRFHTDHAGVGTMRKTQNRLFHKMKQGGYKVRLLDNIRVLFF
jgi:hypothetical protein